MSFVRGVGMWLVAAGLCYALEGMSNEEYAKALQEMKKGLNNKDANARATAVEAFGANEDERVIKELGKLLNSSKGNEVRVAAVKSLGKMESHNALVVLLSGLSTAQPEAVLTAYCAALGDRGASEAKVARIIYPKLSPLMSNQNYKVAAAAMTAVGKLKAKAAMQTLLSTYKENDAKVKKDPDNKNKNTEKYSALQTAALNAIKEITGQDFESPADAEKWWKENAKHFAEFGGLKEGKEEKPKEDKEGGEKKKQEEKKEQ